MFHDTYTSASQRINFFIAGASFFVVFSFIFEGWINNNLTSRSLLFDLCLLDLVLNIILCCTYVTFSSLVF